MEVRPIQPVNSTPVFATYYDYYVAVKQIKPVHLFINYENWCAAVEQVAGDLVPLPIAWRHFGEAMATLDDFSAFVNAHPIENWVFDNGSRHSIRFRFSHFKKAAIKSGLLPDGVFRLR